VVGYAEKRRLGQKPKDLLRNQHRSAAWYEQAAHEGMVEGERGARLIATVEGTDVRIDYEFTDADALRQRFPGLWQRLEPKLRGAGVAGETILDFEDPQRRRWIEPVLVGQLFKAELDYVVLEKSRTADSIAEPAVAVTPPRKSQYGAMASLRTREFGGRPDVASQLKAELSRSLWAGTIEKDGNLVGFVHIDEVDGIPHLQDLVVEEAERGKGYGEALLLAALGWIRDNRPGPIRLYTDFGRSPALALYKKHGFRQLHTGVTFKRPMDPAVIEGILSRRKNTYSRWVGFR
jgi:GNAT superfamily N-acetyltransferase